MKKKIYKFLLGIIICTIMLSTISLANTINYNYDKLNRITSAMYNNGLVLNYDYDELGNITSIYQSFEPDVDLDGNVDTQDINLIKTYYQINSVQENINKLDINLDKVVDMKDVELLCKCYNISKDNDLYKANYDLNNDNVIDIIDIFIILKDII